MKFAYVILDRDGVLNREAPARGYITSVDQFEWLPGALQGLAALHRAGVRVAVATNQSCIGRGLASVADIEAIHAHMRAAAEAAGGRIDHVFYCPHAPQDGCNCRKPAADLIQQAFAAGGVGKSETLVVGDDARDLQAGWRAGIAVALVRTGKGRATEREVRGLAIPTYNDLPTLAQAIVTGTFPTASWSVMSVNRIFNEHARVLAAALESLPPVLERISHVVHTCYMQGHKVLACGNGGSAADAQHLVAELVGRFREERRGLPAIALSSDGPTLTALANDYGYERVFARQVEAHAQPGDVLFAISTSGNSASVVEAARTARGLGCTVVAMTGEGGGRLAECADILLCVPSSVVARIQELHGLSIHAIAELLDEALNRARAE